MSEQDQRPLRQVVEERLQKEVGIDPVDRPGQVILPEDLYELLVQMAMSNPIYHVEEFHRVYGLHVHDQPIYNHSAQHEYRNGMSFDDLADLRLKLLEEELEEYREADIECNEHKLVDALGDIIYVAAGAALELGLPIRLACEEIHRSNMSKLDADGKPIYREDGKILKGPNYTPPNWVEVFEEWAEQKGKV